MKKITKRTSRYLAAASALVAGNNIAEAAVELGVITGDNFLDEHLDMAYIDIDDNGDIDFEMIMYKFSYAYSSYSYTYAAVVLYGTSSSNLIGLDSGSWYWAKNYKNNEVIGPLLRPMDAAAIIGNLFPSYLSASDAVLNNPVYGSIGVSFLKNGNTHFGFLQISTNPTDFKVELFNAFYESTPNEPIVAQYADPVPLIPIASGLGIGIIGLFSLLKRRNRDKSTSKN